MLQSSLSFLLLFEGWNEPPLPTAHTTQPHTYIYVLCKYDIASGAKVTAGV
jgi:hypothetical protein